MPLAQNAAYTVLPVASLRSMMTSVQAMTVALMAGRPPPDSAVQLVPSVVRHRPRLVAAKARFGIAAIDGDPVEAVVGEQRRGMVCPGVAAVGAAQHADAEVNAGRGAERELRAVELHVAFTGSGVQHVRVAGADRERADGQ